MSEFPIVEIGTVARIQSGFSFKSSDWKVDGIPVVKIANVKNGRVDRDGLGYVDEQVAEKATKFSLSAGDVLLAMTGYVGEVAVVREQDLPLLLNQRVGRCEPTSTDVDKSFLYYLLSSADARKQLENLAQGSAQPNLSARDFGLVEVRLPPLAEQRAIAAVLGALDDKIESNRRIWRLRQELAVAYFNLCRSKSEAEIPINDLYRVGLSGVWGEERPTDSSTIETTCLRGRDLEDYMTGSLCAPPARFITSRQLQARSPELGEIWTAGSGSLGPSLLITESVKKRWGAPITNSNFVKRLVPIGGHLHHASAFHVVWESWKSGGFSNFRTGTAMPNLDPDALLRGLSVPQLTIEEIAALTDLTEVALDSQLPKETMALSSLRDALLPELLSGRLRVRDAENAVEGML